MMNRSIPKRCGKCGHQEMRLAEVPYTAKIEYDSRVVRVEIPSLSVPQCGNCATISIDDAADQQISAAFRREAGLLSPEEIRQGRESLGMSQQQFANMLGVGEPIIARWESGSQIQQRPLDRFLRLCISSPAAVEFLQRNLEPSAKGA